MVFLASSFAEVKEKKYSDCVPFASNFTGVSIIEIVMYTEKNL